MMAPADELEDFFVVHGIVSPRFPEPSEELGSTRTYGTESVPGVPQNHGKRETCVVRPDFAEMQLIQAHVFFRRGGWAASVRAPRVWELPSLQLARIVRCLPGTRRTLRWRVSAKRWGVCW